MRAVQFAIARRRAQSGQTRTRALDKSMDLKTIGSVAFLKAAPASDLSETQRRFSMLSRRSLWPSLPLDLLVRSACQQLNSSASESKYTVPR